MQGREKQTDTFQISNPSICLLANVELEKHNADRLWHDLIILKYYTFLAHIDHSRHDSLVMIVGYVQLLLHL